MYIISTRTKPAVNFFVTNLIVVEEGEVGILIYVYSDNNYEHVDETSNISKQPHAIQFAL